MAESSINVTEGGGKRLRTYDRSVSSVLVQEQVVLPGEYPWASYIVQAAGISAATTNDHVLAIAAGSSNRVRIRRIFLEQANPTANTQISATFAVLRTASVAPAGGSAVTPNPHDPADAASGATARTLPTTKGTEGVELFRRRILTLDAVTATGSQSQVPSWEWVQHPGTPPIIIAAGTTNGICVKVLAATATGLAVDVTVEFTETSF